MGTWLSPHESVLQQPGNVTGGITDGAARRPWPVGLVSLGRWLRGAEPWRFRMRQLSGMQDLEAQPGLFSDNQWLREQAALHIVSHEINKQVDFFHLGFDFNLGSTTHWTIYETLILKWFLLNSVIFDAHCNFLKTPWAKIFGWLMRLWKHISSWRMFRCKCHAYNIKKYILYNYFCG